MELCGLTRAREMQVARHLAAALDWPFVDLCEYQISCGVLRRISAELCCRLRCVPMVFNAHRVVVVVDDPYAALYLLANQEILGPPYHHRLQFALTYRSALDACLARRLALVRD